MIKTANVFGPAGFRACTFDPRTFELVELGDSRPDLPRLIPGFVDIHTHGAFGIDFMSASAGEIATLCRRLEEVGYEGFLPTTVTARSQEVARAISALPNDPMILGIHLEGPFISPVYPGAQPKDAIVDPPTGPSDWDAILDDPRIKVVTLAPERPGALPFIERLAARGVRVSLGHTNATYAECRLAYQSGARHTTHTYNAMRPLLHREPGVVGFGLVEDDVFCELIYDRHHVSKPAANVLIRCKPKDRLIAISDSTMAAGLPAGTELRMWNIETVVGDGQVRLKDGTLAGSAITLLDACRNLRQDFGWDVAVQVCAINPRLALGMDPTKPRVYLEVDDEVNILSRYERSISPTNPR